MLYKTTDNPSNKEQQTDRSEHCIESKKIIFLGKKMTTNEYQESCRNLEEFFKILIKWQKKEGLNEKETNL